MELNFKTEIDPKQLFLLLYNSKTEEDVEELISKNEEFFKPNNWTPLGGDENMFGIVRNQQSNPIAALVEKITNSIDAVLMKKCYEEGIDPKSSKAPKSMEEAIHWFF